MKKTIALVLALVLSLSMASVAFACDAALTYGECEVDSDLHMLPGESYALEIENNIAVLVGSDTANYNSATADEVVWSDDDHTSIDDAALVLTDSTNGFDCSDWKISSSWTKGGALVSGVAYDKDDEVIYLTLNENYTITAPKDLVGTITLTSKGDSAKYFEDTLGYEDVVVELSVEAEVCNHLSEVEVYEDLEDAEDSPVDAEDNTIYYVDEDEAGYVVFNTSSLLTATLNLESEEKVYMANDEEMIEALEDAYPNADIECYNFGSIRSLKNAATLTLQADYADQYEIYEYSNGKLLTVDAEWDSIEGVYVWKTKNLGSYVISDTELVAASTDDSDTDDTTASTGENPDTGDHDIIGAAAALAVISLVAAGAVSIKKNNK